MDLKRYIENGVFLMLVLIALYLLFVGINEKYMTRRAQRNLAARRAFRSVKKEGGSWKDARAAYRFVKREWRPTRRKRSG